ncbi:hypothetical protein HAZT_HAZT003037 [Hyalella azteca]|uniref:Max-binding protein MNT n=1 Tax=Hyalella azteca TaxID=294128 RepID=A0A6A0HCM7_HYAAZ|nr:hypothetical protein HAZT_HAZT003037 [Hyalella azteca]
MLEMRARESTPSFFGVPRRVISPYIETAKRGYDYTVDSKEADNSSCFSPPSDALYKITLSKEQSVMKWNPPVFPAFHPRLVSYPHNSREESLRFHANHTKFYSADFNLRSLPGAGRVDSPKATWQAYGGESLAKRAMCATKAAVMRRLKYHYLNVRYVQHLHSESPISYYILDISSSSSSKHKRHLLETPSVSHFSLNPYVVGPTRSAPVALLSHDTQVQNLTRAVLPVGPGKGTLRNTPSREVHNKLEKNRRAHLKECFDLLKRQVPNLDEKKVSNQNILKAAYKCINTLKRKERDYEHEMERLAREKISKQQHLAALKKELSARWDHIDFNIILPDMATASPHAGIVGHCVTHHIVSHPSLLTYTPQPSPQSPLTSDTPIYSVASPSYITQSSDRSQSCGERLFVAVSRNGLSSVHLAVPSVPSSALKPGEGIAVGMPLNLTTSSSNNLDMSNSSPAAFSLAESPIVPSYVPLGSSNVVPQLLPSMMVTPVVVSPTLVKSVGEVDTVSSSGGMHCSVAMSVTSPHGSHTTTLVFSRSAPQMVKSSATRTLMLAGGQHLANAALVVVPSVGAVAKGLNPGRGELITSHVTANNSAVVTDVRN